MFEHLACASVKRACTASVYLLLALISSALTRRAAYLHVLRA